MASAAARLRVDLLRLRMADKRTCSLFSGVLTVRRGPGGDLSFSEPTHSIKMSFLRAASGRSSWYWMVCNVRDTARIGGHNQRFGNLSRYGIKTFFKSTYRVLKKGITIPAAVATTRVLKMSEDPATLPSTSSTEMLPATSSDEPLDKKDDDGKKRSWRKKNQNLERYPEIKTVIPLTLQTCNVDVDMKRKLLGNCVLTIPEGSATQNIEDTAFTDREAKSKLNNSDGVSVAKFPDVVTLLTKIETPYFLHSLIHY
ncbi:hypothetical protein C0J52_05559 [Blattella germanica]|nr:hypothetical protein C0J52_05559 [Blattella germanica]